MINTNVYFVRHAQSDHTIKDDLNRPLTTKGLEDTKKVTKTLKDKGITKIYSSPYLRSMETIKDLAKHLGQEILTIDDFRERRVGGWVEDFKEFSRKQWEDFNFKHEGGETLKEVQDRNISALLKVIKDNEGENIAIGTHGTALSTMINNYDSKFGYDSFWNIIDRMPYLLCFQFQGKELLKIEELELQE